MRYLVDSDITWSITQGEAGQRPTLDLLLSRYRAMSPTEEITRRAYSVMKTYARSHGLHPLDALIAASCVCQVVQFASGMSARPPEL